MEKQTKALNIPWGDERLQAVTGVGLITSNGKHGHNIMAAEWTHHVSYEPGLIAVHIGPHKATAENIAETKEFGVSIASEKQNVLASVAGGQSGKQYDKIAALKELGYKFYKAKKLDVMMVEETATNTECRLVDKIKIGDHTMFVGEVVALSGSSERPVVYHHGKYWKTGEQIMKPSQEELDRIKMVIEKHRKR